MASGKGTSFANQVLNLLNGVSITAPATVYIALFTTEEGAGGTGTEVVSGVGYSRVAVTCNTTNFPTASNGSISNGTVIAFGTATGNWGTVTNFGIMPASTGQNPIYYCDLTVSKTLTSGDTCSFGVGELTITES
jgi:hypothetical protein